MPINNCNPSIYGYEDEDLIDKLIDEIELDDKEIINKKAKEVLATFFVEAQCLGARLPVLGARFFGTGTRWQFCEASAKLCEIM